MTPFSALALGPISGRLAILATSLLGSQYPLREVIDRYERVTKEKDKHPNLSPLLRGFKLAEQQKRDLEAPMLTLTGDNRDPRINVVPPLPQMEPALDVVTRARGVMGAPCHVCLRSLRFTATGPGMFHRANRPSDSPPFPSIGRFVW